MYFPTQIALEYTHDFLKTFLKLYDVYGVYGNSIACITFKLRLHSAG